MRTVDAVGTALEHEAAKQGGILDPDAVGARRAGPQSVELALNRGKRCLGEKACHAVGELVDDRDQEVCAATRRVENTEPQQLLAGALGVGARGFLDALEVGLVGGHDSAADEVAHQRLGRVVDAAALATGLVGQPQQFAAADLDLLGVFGREVAVATGFAAIVAVCNRQPQGKEALVDVAEVAYVEPRVVEAGIGLRVDPQRGQRRPECAVGYGRALERPCAVEAVGGEQGAVVGRDGHGVVARRHGVDDCPDPPPEGARARAQPIALLRRIAHDLRQRVRLVGLLGDRQMAGRLGIEQEQRAEDERERRRLEVGACLAVGDVDPLLGGPPAELTTEHRQHVLTDGAVEPLAQPDAEGAGLGHQLGEALAGEVGR